MRVPTLVSAAVVAALGLAVLAPDPALGQVPGWETQRLRAGVGATLESYSFADPAVANVETLSLFTTSVAASVPVAGPVAVGLAGRYARGTLERADGTTSTVDGLTDTELTLSIPIRRGNLVTTVGAMVLLPTGSSALTEEEADLAGMIASELLPFRISYWGSGGGAGGSLGAVYGGVNGSVGVSAGYLVTRSFEPLQGSSFAYQPGNQLQLRAAADRAVGASGKLTLALSLLHSDADLGDGTNLYQTGNRYQAMGSYSFAAGSRASAILYLGAAHRGEGEALRDVTRGMPAQDVILAGAGARIPAGGGVLLPSADARVFRRESGEDQGYLTGLGLAWERAAGGVMVVPSVRGRFGRLVVVQGSETGITGFDVGLALRSARRPGH